MKFAAFANERGASLVEVLVSVAIIAIILTIFLSALSAASLSVAVVRERVTAENLARAQLECIQDHPYIEGATPISYTNVCTVTVPALPSYHSDLSISYWYSPTAQQPFTTTHRLDLDLGMQWITVTIFYKSEPVFTIGNYKVDR